MGALGIVLVHGYTGSADQLAPLAHALCRRFGDDAVRTVRLPGHAADRAPAFDAALFEKAIAGAVTLFQNQGRRIVLVGHSTGGCLVLGYLLSGDIRPALLILAGTPASVKGRDLERWERHRNNQKIVALGDTARMVSHINRMGRSLQPKSFPVLVLQGGDDALVDPMNAEAWRNGRFRGPVQGATIPRAGHDLFLGPGRRAALDCVCRALSDMLMRPQPEDLEAAAAISSMESGATDFMAANSSRTSHLVRSPAALSALGKPFQLTPVMETDPVQVNIEITSRCNLACAHCARSLHRKSGRDMDGKLFEYLLDLMPNTYKVTLVGLGEPTLHPQVAEFVALASRRGHRVGLVTNAMALEKELSRRLIAAGLQAMTFSLDSVDSQTAARVRTGSDLDRITRNIRDFTRLAHGRMPTAVFTAVSSRTVLHLPDLANTATGLGISAWMLSDMNFHANLSNTIWKNWNQAYRTSVGQALRLAFASKLPVLSVRGLEALGLGRRYRDYLLTVPAGIGQRSQTRQWCVSPWQTLPVDADGNVTVCDCRPHGVIGNLLDNSFSDIWNGEAMQAHRRAMESEEPPEDCLICPRF